MRVAAGAEIIGGEEVVELGREADGLHRLRSADLADPAHVDVGPLGEEGRQFGELVEVVGQASVCAWTRLPVTGSSRALITAIRLTCSMGSKSASLRPVTVPRYQLGARSTASR